MTRDPIGYGGGINLYGYVANNPENSVDPNVLSKNDKWYGYKNRDFQKWFHRCWKEKGDPDADKAEIEEAYKEWVKRGSPTDGNCWGGKSLLQPCKAPQRMMHPTAEEWRMDAESHRQMERFWMKIGVGSVVGGAVIIGGPAAGAAVLRVIRAVPVRPAPGPVLGH